MTPLELQALAGRLLPSDFNVGLTYDYGADQFRLDVSNWCQTKQACMFPVEHLDQPENMIERALKPVLEQAVRELRASQTKNRYNS